MTRFAYVKYAFLFPVCAAAVIAGFYMMATDPIEVERVVDPPALTRSATPQEIQGRVGDADGQVTAEDLRGLPDGLVCSARSFDAAVALVCWQT